MKHVTVRPGVCSCGASGFPTVLAFILHQSSANGTGFAERVVKPRNGHTNG